MAERYTLEDHQAYRQKVEEKRAKETEQMQERAQKGAARVAWIADGGSRADFEREWPRLRDEARKQRVIDADKLARQRMTASKTSRI